MDSENLYRQIILDHYSRPHNRVESVPDEYIELHGSNPSCGDELSLYVDYEGGKVHDIKFNGSGCAICCASTSVMTKELEGLSKEEVLTKVDNFEKLIKGEEADGDIFEDAIAFAGTSKFPARFKCAFLSWKTIEEFLEQSN